MFQETDQPLLTEFVEKRSDVGVNYPVHLCAVDSDRERIQRIVRAASGSESVREPEEVFLVDRVEHRDRRPLDDLVLQRGNRERTLFPITPSVCTSGVTAVPDMLPDEPAHADQ